ncbi:ABC transporter ATP-binding protein [Rapidithrix thailandica]|uniref:ABC transporter ATP-binding protein n=1 Tax=Rapidithrix thailandica TaxID=413964 RepID=A0AAW9S5J4_9BACT
MRKPQAANNRQKSNFQSFRQQLDALKNLPQFFRLVWEASPWMTLTNAGLRLFKSALPLAMLYVGKLIIDEVVLLSGQEDDPPLSRLWGLLALEFALAIVSDLMNRAITLLDSLLGDLFSNITSVKLIRHAATLDLHQFEDAAFYDKLERARRQTVGRVVLMSLTFSQIQELITLMFLATGLVVFNPWLILILIIAVVPSFIGETHFNEKSYSISRQWTAERRELDYLRYVGASDETAKEIKIFNLAGFLANRFKNVSDKYYQTNKKLAVKRATWGSLLTAVGTVSYYAAYVFILLATVAGSITLGDLTFLSGSFNRMRNSLQSIVMRFADIAEGALYLKDLFDFFDIKPQVKSGTKNYPVPRPIQKGFTFENVGFQYDNNKRWAVRNLSFHLQAGEKLALVGENGAGKTTLVKLLARLYDPTEGRILLDGIDLKDYDLQDLRKTTGVIFQDYVRFQMTASENIAVGNIQEQENKHRINVSAYKSLANTVIDKLPDRYKQVLGRRFAQGVELSGGEWQKIALARAYMGEAQLLILDEPTSSLDARAEHEVFLRFAKLIQGKSAVLISHRFSTVRMADRILFLENGQLKELGTHEELLDKKGKYAELFQLQARGYH